MGALGSKVIREYLIDAAHEVADEPGCSEASGYSMVWAETQIEPSCWHILHGGEYTVSCNPVKCHPWFSIAPAPR